MMRMHGLRLMIVLAMTHLPASAMLLNNTVTQRINRSIGLTLVGAIDGDEALYSQGINGIRMQQGNLPNMTFKALEWMPVFERMFLKVLVIRKEKQLLPDFLDMYLRSYPRARDGINFTYKMEMRKGRAKEMIDYTLLDVALASYSQAPGTKQAENELEIMRVLIERGGALKLYSAVNFQEGPIIHHKKRCRRAGGPQEPLAEEPTVFPPSDVGLLLEMQGISDNENIELESGLGITFDLDDSK